MLRKRFDKMINFLRNPHRPPGKGISKFFKAMFVASDAFCDEDCIDSSWKEELEEYMEENEKKESNNTEIEW